eukprot:COSAG01_NODE_197_length_22333_cov_45.774759_2_plen_84_part_00
MWYNVVLAEVDDITIQRDDMDMIRLRCAFIERFRPSGFGSHNKIRARVQPRFMGECLQSDSVTAMLRWQPDLLIQILLNSELC